MTNRPKRLRSIGQQRGTKSGHRFADKPRINRWSNAGWVPPPLYIVFRLFVLLERRSEHVCSIPWKVRGSVVSWANRPVGVPSCPAPPRRPAVRRPVPTRPWYVRVSNSTGSFVRVAERSFETVVFDIRKGKTVGCFLGERTVGILFYLALPRDAARRALDRSDPPVICSGFRFDMLMISSSSVI